MKVSLNWLREFVAIPADVAALSDLLTRAGVEVEGIEQKGVALQNVVVAQILESKQHPNADRLSVCQVNDGSALPRQIVCGAKNYRVGDKVPLALPGAVLPGEFKIKASKLRGVDSEGMLCSARELSLTSDVDGLLILPADATVGRPLAELYPADTVLDLEITPNRPDLLSHAGMAREIAALTATSWSGSIPLAPDVPPTSAGVEISVPALCPFYSAWRVSGARVADSPEWMRRKLEAIGLRSINNIVDITNFVMMETGQPLHAFDAAKVEGAIRVRFATEGESFLALDGRERSLDARDLVIADSQRVLALAGVMGGQESGVSSSTTEVILEAAIFDPASVRRTARRLALGSDSSYRFERGVDPARVLPAARRAVELICEVAGGSVGVLSTAGVAWSESSRPRVALRYQRCNQVLGTSLVAPRVDAILAGFGLSISAREADSTTWIIPPWRHDLPREIDLIEEVMRVVGMDSIPPKCSARYAPGSLADLSYDRETALRQNLAGQGFFETRSLSLVSAKAAQAFGLEAQPLRNPLNEEQTLLRPSLLPGLTRVAESNARLGTKDLRLFEVGRVFVGGGEQTNLGILLTGAVAARSWREPRPRAADLFDLKGALSALGLGAISFQAADNPAFALSLTLSLNGEPVGLAGVLWPAFGRDIGFASPILVAEINLSACPLPVRGAKTSDVALYPGVSRDIALLAPLEIPHARIQEVIDSAREPLLERVELFDLFNDPTGEKLPLDRKSLAYSLTYRSPNRTLTSEEVNAAHARLKDRLKSELEVQFRE